MEFRPVNRSAPARMCAVVVLWFLPGLAWAEEAASPLPFAANGGAGYLAQLLVGLLVVLAAIVALAFMMRRMTGVQSRLGSEFRVVSGISLGARERMLLVQVGEQQLVVGVAPGRVQTLHVLDKPIEAAARAPAGGVAAQAESPFARRLRAVLQRGAES
jgi:flagellar protein FliO/FliZ